MKKLLVSATLSMAMAFSVFAESAQIVMPVDGWSISFNKPDNTSSADLSYEKAPDCSDAIRIKFSGSTIANINMPAKYVAEAASRWPGTFKGIQGFIWNDGKNNLIKMSFTVPVQENGKPKQKCFYSFFKVDHSGWQFVTCQSAINFDNQQAKLKPSDISSVYITMDKHPGAEIAIGALTWMPEGIALVRKGKGNSAPVYFTKTSPSIDGEDDDLAWKNVPSIQLEHILGNLTDTPTNKTSLKIIYDEKNVYILAQCSFKDKSKMKATIRDYDAALWLEEDVEVFLYPEADPRMYYQLIVSPLGARMDLAMKFDPLKGKICFNHKNWNPEWKATAKIGKSSWIAELSIPWKAIGAIKPPALLQFQASRNDTTANQCALWSPNADRPGAGPGFLTLNETPFHPTTILGMAFTRGLNNKYLFNCTVIAEKQFKELTVRTHFCAPRSAPEVYTKTIPVNEKAAAIEFAIDSNKLLNGEYLTAVEFIPDNKELSIACETYYFNQTLPSTVKFSDIVFNPAPKILEWKSGVFAPVSGDAISVQGNATERTVKTAAYQAKRMNGVYGITPEVRKATGGRLIMSVNKEFVKDRTQSDSREAYTLEVTSENITITGADEAGLYYGVVTLMQLMQGSKLPNVSARALTIADWPTYNQRITATLEEAMTKKDIGDGNGGHQIERYKEWIEKSVAGNKYNILLMGWADQINYESIPQVHCKNNFKPDDIKELFAFAREHFIEASAGACLTSHGGNTWLRHFPQLKETGLRHSQFDLTLPTTYNLMGKMYNELMDIAGEESRYFMVRNDAMYDTSRTIENSAYKGESRQEIFYKFLMAQYQVVTRRKKQMVIFTDSLDSKIAGGEPWNLSAVTDRLPKNIIMSTWSNAGNIGKFAEKGFAAWTILCRGLSVGWSIDNGFGYSTFLWNNDLFNFTEQNRILSLSYLIQFPYANYAWNKLEKGDAPWDEWTLQNLPAYIGSFSFKPNPAAGNTLTAYEIPKDTETVNMSELNEITKISSVGEIPVTPGMVFVGPKAKFEFMLPQGTRQSSFYILGAVFPTNIEAEAQLRKDYRKIKSSAPYGIIMGKYRIVYADGTHAETEIRLGRNMGLFQYTPAQSRYCYEVRAVYPLTDDQEKGLTQFEMINPNPDKEIKAFEVTGNFDYAPILLCGLTGRSVR